MSAIYVLSLMLLLTAASHRSFVDTAPLSQQEVPVPPALTKTQDANVKELESLKHTLVKSDGKLVARLEQHIDGESNGPGSKPQGNIQAVVDIPSKGIHSSTVQHLQGGDDDKFTNNGNRRTFKIDNSHDVNNNVEKFTSYSGVQYTPLDMAEYVFWTGDEKGVTLAIEEFLQEGMMTREEAITFLQEIKYNLDYLQTHYSQQGLHSQDHSKQDRANNVLRNFNKPSPMAERPIADSSFDAASLRQDIMKKHTLKAAPTINNKAETYETEKQEQTSAAMDEDYEELLERLKVADFLYTEYSLEEVIYQLAKVMFTQSLTRGNAEAQDALQKFTNFLETEAEDGHISRSLEKKVLDVLIAALTDTLTEHPELDTSSPSTMTASSSAETNLLKQFLGLDPAQQRRTLKNLKEQQQQQQQLQQQGNFADNVRIQLNQKPKSNNHSLNTYKTL